MTTFPNDGIPSLFILSQHKYHARLWVHQKELVALASAHDQSFIPSAERRVLRSQRHEAGGLFVGVQSGPG
jgi:hypothetical protein